MTICKRHRYLSRYP